MYIQVARLSLVCSSPTSHSGGTPLPFSPLAPPPRPSSATLVQWRWLSAYKSSCVLSFAASSAPLLSWGSWVLGAGCWRWHRKRRGS